jgi:hypothetical protein
MKIRNRLKKLFVASTGAAILAGCTSPPVLESHSAALNAAPVCCSSPRDAKFTLLPNRDEVRVEVSTLSPALLFSEGKSFFHAYRLQPANKDFSRLTVRTFAVNTLSIASAHVFIPRLTFFDSAFNKIESVTPEMAFHSPKFAIGESWWQGDVSVDPKAAYVFVHSGLKERAMAIRMRDTDAGAMYAGGVVIPNSRGYRLIPGGPTGEVSLSLSTK